MSLSVSCKVVVHLQCYLRGCFAVTQTDLDALVLDHLRYAREVLLETGCVPNLLLALGAAGPVAFSLDSAPRVHWPAIARTLHHEHHAQWLLHISEAWWSARTDCQPVEDPKRQEVLLVEATCPPGLLSFVKQPFTRPGGAIAFAEADLVPTGSYGSYLFGIDYRGRAKPH